MKGKQLIVLVIAAVAVVGLAVMTQNRSRRVAPTQVGKAVLPGLQVNDITKIVVSTMSETATVQRTGGVWVSAEKYDYPADFAKVRKALIDLSELKIGQVVSNPSDSQRQALKMLSPGVSADDAGTLVELYGKVDAPVASLLLGSEHERHRENEGAMGRGYPDGRYVSPDGGQSVYLVAEPLNQIGAKSLGWIDPDIANVSAQDITGVTIDRPGEESLVLTKEGSDLVLAGLAEDEEMDSSKSWSIKAGLSYLRAEDIAPPTLDDAAFGLSNAVAYTATTKDGEIYKALVGAAPAGSENRYLRLSAALTPEEQSAKDPAEETDEEKAAREKLAGARAERQAKIDEFNQRLNGWTFVISGNKAGSLLLTRDGVVKKKEKADETDAADAANETDGETAAE